MLLSTLRRDWQAAHVGGDVWITDHTGALLDSGKQTGMFAVTYETCGKVYTYRYKSVYALAEKLGMIPDNDLDYWVESRKAIDALRAGKDYVSICGLWDTIVHLDESLLHTCRSDSAGRDEYDRQLYRFYLINKE